MKRIVFAGMLMLSTICSAQKLTQEQFFLSKGLIDIQSGISIPAGDFALSNYTLPAGYAKNGYNVKVGFSYDLAPYLGLALQYQYTQNPFNSKDLLSDAQKLPSDLIYNSYTSDPWKLQAMFLGVYYPFKAAKTTIDIRLFGGIFSATLPESIENITVPSLNNQNFNFKQIENTSSGFGFQSGIKIRHQLYKQLLVTSSIDYLQTKIKFENIRVTETNSGHTFKSEDYSQKFQLLNISLGIGIQFN